MSNKPTLIKDSESEFLYETFLKEVSDYMPLDYDILCFDEDDPTGNVDFFEAGPGNNRYRNLCHYVALGGVLPSVLRAAAAAGLLFHWTESSYTWAEEFFPGCDVETCPEKALVIIKPNGKNGGFNKATREAMIAVEDKGVIFYTYDRIYTEMVLEAVVDKATVEGYFHNLKAKLVNGWWEIRMKRGINLDVKFDKGVWFYKEGSQERQVRNFHSLNGEPVINPHKILLITLNYLLGSRDQNTFKGRRAFLSGVFTDQVTLGYSHAILDRGISNKLGTLGVYMNEKHHAPILYNTKDILSPAAKYEELGYSVFFHKGAKYAIINADCVGFTRKEGKTHIPYHADKRAKFTGRVLCMVPTAAEYIDDDED
jgi:hypothetical protein